MTEGGDIHVLPPPSLMSKLVPTGRRRLSLTLDLTSLTSSEDFHVSKKCKLESMNFSLSHGSPLNRGSVSASPIRTIQCNELASRLTKGHKSTLLVDCRSFISYNMAHIEGAINVNCCDRFNRKRLQQGKVSLVDLVTSKEGKDLFKRRGSREMVLYDEGTHDLHQLSSDNALYLVVTSLLREGKEVVVLKGGLEEFRANHSDLCHNGVKLTVSPPLYSPTAFDDAQIESAGVSQILPYLYLGNERDASDYARLKELNITHVLNTTSHVPKYFEKQGITYKRVAANDNGSQNLRKYFEEAISFIDDAHEKGANVLIHCHAGVSRSSAITIAYLLKRTNLSMMDCYRYVKSKRAIISPNFNFMGQLMEYEQSLNNGTSQRTLQPKVTLLDT